MKLHYRHIGKAAGMWVVVSGKSGDRMHVRCHIPMCRNTIHQETFVEVNTPLLATAHDEFHRNLLTNFYAILKNC